MYIPCIYMVYTLSIHCICSPQAYPLYILGLVQMGLFSTFFCNDMPIIYQVYSMNILHSDFCWEKKSNSLCVGGRRRPAGFFFFFLKSQGKRLSCLTHWSPVLKAPSAPSFTKIQVIARYKTRKMERRQRHHRRRCRHRRHQLQAGNVGGSRVEPFVGSLFPWRNCHGGAWNKTLLVTSTRVRIEWDQQHWHGPAAKSGFRTLGISMDIPQYTTYIPCIYIQSYTMYIHGYTMYILDGYTC